MNQNESAACSSEKLRAWPSDSWDSSALTSDFPNGEINVW